MARPYGKIPNRFRQARDQKSAAPTRNLRIKINGRYDLEQTSILLQRIIARLQDSGVASIENCALYLTPLGSDGGRIAFKNEKGEPLETIEIAMPVAARFSDASGP